LSQSKHVEDAELRRAANWDRERLRATVSPGSRAEADALLRIDLARENERERLQDTDPEKRRRRQSRYWRKRGVHVEV